MISTYIAWQYAAMLFTSELAPFLSCDGPIKYVKTLQRIFINGFWGLLIANVAKMFRSIAIFGVTRSIYQLYHKQLNEY